MNIYSFSNGLREFLPRGFKLMKFESRVVFYRKMIKTENSDVVSYIYVIYIYTQVVSIIIKFSITFYTPV